MSLAGEVKPLRFCCSKVLPLVYDDWLTEYEGLCKVSYKLNEVIELVNSFQDDFKDYTDQQVDALRQEITQKLNKAVTELNQTMQALETKVNQQLADNEAKMKALEDYVNGAISDNQIWISTKIAGLEQKITEQINYLKQYVDAQDNLLKGYIDDEIQKVIDMIPEITSVMVVNPITGKLEPIQDALDYLTWVFRYYAYTALGYDNEQFTAEYFDNAGLSAWEYDVYGCKILHADMRFHMRSPITGEIVCYKDVINWLIAQHRANGLTASEYDALELTATVYDGKALSAFDYDFNAKTLLSA